MTQRKTYIDIDHGRKKLGSIKWKSKKKPMQPIWKKTFSEATSHIYWEPFLNRFQNILKVASLIGLALIFFIFYYDHSIKHKTYHFWRVKNLKVFKQPFIMVAPLCFFKFLSKYQIFSLLSCEETSLKENQKRWGETNQTSHLQNDLKSDEERSLINVSSRFWKGFFLNWLQSFGSNPNQLLLSKFHSKLYVISDILW